MTALRTGLEIAFGTGFRYLVGRRVGVLCNQTAIARVRRGASVELVHLVDALRSQGLTVERLYGPEHGLWATAQDMIAVDGGRDPIFDLPVETLYGRDEGSLVPRPEALDGIDVLVVDIQDIGARYYTFAATLCLCLEAAAPKGVEVVILDRPNPLGGEAIEGNRVDDAFRSFVGLFDLPQRHALTMGEIARLYVAEKDLDVSLAVVRCEGWDPSRFLDENADHGLGLAWTMPSPNMPTIDTAVVYPGMCLIEGTNLSEGRGTTRPFEIAGAPFLDAVALARALADLQMDGVSWRAMRFEPTFQKHARQVCGGVAMVVHDRAVLRPVFAGLTFVDTCRRMAPEAFAWRTETYEFVQDRLAFDLLMGSTQARTILEDGGCARDIVATFASHERRFAERASPHLLYVRASGPLRRPCVTAVP